MPKDLVRTQCVVCGSRFKLEREHLGKPVTCPHCAERFLASPARAARRRTSARPELAPKDDLLFSGLPKKLKSACDLYLFVAIGLLALAAIIWFSIRRFDGFQVFLFFYTLTVAVLSITAALCLSRRAPGALGIAYVATVPMLIHVPVGTAIGVAILVCLNDADVKAFLRDGGR